MNKPLNVVMYARVSTENQKEEKTITLQSTAIKKFCEDRNYQLVDSFQDNGVSGGIENRSGLASLFAFLESSEGKNVDAVVSWKLDRIARDLYIQEHLIKKIEQLGKKLISTKEPNLDSKDPMRKAFRQFIGIVSELEKAFITMRLSGGRINKANAGKYAGGAVALGYTSKDGELQLLEEESKIIKTIFHLRRYKGFSLREITSHLDNLGYQTKKGNGNWHPSSVAYILKNRLYKGLYQYKGIETKRNDLAILGSSSV